MELNKNLYLIFVGLFFAICLALGGAVWYSLNVLYEYREEYDVMLAERESFSNTMEALKNKNRMLRQIAGMDFQSSNPTANLTEFFSYATKAIENNDLNLLSRQTSENSFEGSATNILTMKLQGNYYSLIRLFSDWRNMPFVARITSLRINRNQESPGFSVDADVVLEAYSAGDN